MLWLLSTTFITQLNGVQDQESLLPPLGQDGIAPAGCSVRREARELESQSTNPSSVEYYYSSRSQYQAFTFGKEEVENTEEGMEALMVRQ